ncbi:MAG: hypothetical protein AAGD28_21145 [Bacteroidota bacterium]
MKYFEYVYLILMVMALVFLSKEWESLPGQSRIMLCVVTGIFAFMFSFRRTQRLRAEKAWEAEMQAEEEEAEETEEEI